MADKMSIDNKPDPVRPDESDDSVDSTPEQEQTSSVPAPGNTNSATQDGQQPKRKGGRKPIYATSEERKQRNRQAQAAFRERRSEYIKQLEETIRVHESNLHNLQTAHRNAADECLMLRYKNSLLERILLEKGIDVQAELQAKSDSPNLGPAHQPQNMVQPPTIQRPIMNRQHGGRKSNSSIAPKVKPEPGAGVIGSQLLAQKSGTSPKNNRPTPSSLSNSPNNGGSTFSPAPSDSISMRGSMGLGRPQLGGGASHNPRATVMQQTNTPRSTAAGAGNSFYATPNFQNPMEHQEHDFDVQQDMLDDSELETPNGAGAFFNSDTTQPMLLSPTSTGPAHHDQAHSLQASAQGFPTMTQLLDHNIDWDPFGLSASMAFPNQQFSFDQTTLR